MSRLRKISGKDCIKILCNKFDFRIIRQKGSHIMLKKEIQSESVSTVVSLHAELKIGALKGILRLAKVDEQEFEKYA